MKFNNTHHEAFAKFFEAPTRASLRDLLKNDIGETDYLDFKREWPDYPKVARHVLALGNSGGGALILGVEEDKNGVLRPVGVGSLRGKEDVYKGIKSYLPSEIRMDVLDFSYSESEYRSIQGLSFQVMVVEYDAELVPLLASRSGTGIKENVVYVRKGTSSEEANGY
jgi:predicted HTH transcriptional regulator